MSLNGSDTEGRDIDSVLYILLTLTGEPANVCFTVDTITAVTHRQHAEQYYPGFGSKYTLLPHTNTR